jgi:hypothetical protein
VIRGRSDSPVEESKGEAMNRIRTVGLCLVAAFASSAMLAASAPAESHVDHGPVVTDSIGGLVELIMTPESQDVEVICNQSTDEGEITSPKTDTETITFTGCEDGTLQKCNSIGQAVGTIVTNPLATELGWISKAKGEVGVDFKPQAGIHLMEFECEGGVKFSINGSVIALIRAINMMTVTNMEIFKESAPAVQEPESFEGGSKDTLVSEFSFGGPPTQFASTFDTQATTEDDEQETFTPPNDPDFYPDPIEIGTVQSGTPEYGRCRKPGGHHWKYSDANCTTRSTKNPPKGKWEWFPVPN